MKIWYFHGQYKTNGFGTNEISYNIFNLRHIISCRLLEEKQNVHIFTQVSKQRKWKILKNEAAEPYLEPCQISVMGRFCQKNTTAKRFIIDV